MGTTLVDVIACYCSGSIPEVKHEANDGDEEELLPRGSTSRQADTEHAPPGAGASELLYSRVVDDVRAGGLSVPEMAQLIGVAERQVRNWSAGANTPSGRNRDRLLQLHYVSQLLRDVYTHEGAEIWLHGRKRSLDGRRPIDLLAAGEYEEVLAAIERLQSGAM
jgi:DNA-binding transcriptional regulator YiaG